MLGIQNLNYYKPGKLPGDRTKNSRSLGNPQKQRKMEIYGQFFHEVTYPDGNKRIIEVIGDRGVVRLDGRHNKANHIKILREVAKDRNFLGFRIMLGRTLLEAAYVSPLILA